ncbi:MAG TPA: carboxypeptidase-like regulatory domain-containing protein [Pyrinomonadaceae bacterium]|nr:carboxypeptidase-like regulatory domain-containing protein [Pyrinomonadaceae bacterium]
MTTVAKDGLKSNLTLSLYYLVIMILAASQISDLAAQSGGAYEIGRSVVASGGTSTGGTYSLAGTAGQSVTNTSSATPFAVRSGFWQPNLGPTAATVSVSGRVTTAVGNGIRNVRVTLTDGRGVIRSSITGAFGYFRFDDIEVGQTVVLSIVAKRHSFANPTRILSVQEEIADVDFIAEP